MTIVMTAAIVMIVKDANVVVVVMKILITNMAHMDVTPLKQNIVTTVAKKYGGHLATGIMTIATVVTTVET